MLSLRITCGLLLAALAHAGLHRVSEQRRFIHPGLMYSAEQTETFRSNALSGEEPWASTYEALKSDPRASYNYTMRGPATIIGNTDNATINSNAKKWEADVLAVHLNSLNFAISKDPAYASKVTEIVDAWSSTLEEVTPGSNFVGGLIGFGFINGIELVKHVNGGRWPSGEQNFKRVQKMAQTLLMPVKNAAARPPDQPAAGGNQAFLSHMAGMSFAIFTNNRTGFEEELDTIMHPFEGCIGDQGGGMQALLHPVTGQNAEAGRDQGHAADEVGWIEQAARVAANQGHTELFDLKSQDGNETPLILLAVEYYFKYNLGYDVPFDDTWHPCCCGNVNYKVISDKDRGIVKPIGEAAYNYYVGQKGLSMPYTTEWLLKKRPLQVAASNVLDFLSYGTLVWAFSDL
ncbi:hypothetical protein ASPCAL14460 [Aspergillus calidoustus]|uniref:Alginate lyase domain-containing protein n=1 Tax=Aspergillus calidoustus TaxID=454130 RepID=A0A0U5GJC9_ASPCI|nr:hypothetical protein ASPCAL14460 [Aspergillus calidoustus]